jgi:hypothetical protein
VLVQHPIPGDGGLEVGWYLRPGGRCTLTLDPIREGFVKDRLELAALFVGDCSHFREQLRVSLRREFGLHVHHYREVL